MIRFIKLWFVVAGVAIVSASASAGELSLMKGFYESTKVPDGLETTVMSLGSRYLDSMGGKMSWYGDFALGIKSYSAPSNEPGNQTDIDFGGGVRMKLSPLSEKITPYISGGVHYKSVTSDVSWSPASTTWVQTSGLYYRGDVGLHISISSDFFIDLETALFDSPLSAKDKRVAKTPTGETKDEVDHMNLFVKSTGTLAATTVAVGLRI